MHKSLSLLENHTVQHGEHDEVVFSPSVLCGQVDPCYIHYHLSYTSRFWSGCKSSNDGASRKIKIKSMDCTKAS